jgi:hypothetical protein
MHPKSMAKIDLGLGTSNRSQIHVVATSDERKSKDRWTNRINRNSRHSIVRSWSSKQAQSPCSHLACRSSHVAGDGDTAKLPSITRQDTRVYTNGSESESKISKCPDYSKLYKSQANLRHDFSKLNRSQGNICNCSSGLLATKRIGSSKSRRHLIFASENPLADSNRQF